MNTTETPPRMNNLEPLPKVPPGRNLTCDHCGQPFGMDTGGKLRNSNKPAKKIAEGVYRHPGC